MSSLDGEFLTNNVIYKADISIKVNYLQGKEISTLDLDKKFI